MSSNSAQTPSEGSNDGGNSAGTAENERPIDSGGYSFWRHVKESMSLHHFSVCLMVMLIFVALGQRETLSTREGGTPQGLSMAGILTIAGIVCVAFAILIVSDYWTRPRVSPRNSSKKNEQSWGNFVILIMAWLIFRPHTSQTSLPHANNAPPAKVISSQTPPPAQPMVVRAASTLAYWNTAVRNLHEVRFKVTPSERPSEQVGNEFFGQLKVLSDQANVAPWDNVDPELVQMVIRHSFIDGKAFQLKTQIEEWRKQNPTSPENSVSFNQAMAIGQQIMSAVEADSDILNKLPEGPVREFVQSAVEYEQLALDQLHEIEAMQSTLQERYPSTEFPLPDIGE